MRYKSGNRAFTPVREGDFVMGYVYLSAIITIIIGLIISTMIIGLIIYCITGLVCYLLKKKGASHSPFIVFCVVDIVFAAFAALAAFVPLIDGESIGEALLSGYLIVSAEPAMAILFVFSLIFGFIDKRKSKKRQKLIEDKSRYLREKYNKTEYADGNRKNVTE